MSEKQQDNLNKIVANLADEDSDVRRWAIYDLEQFPPEQTVEHLVRGTEDEHRAVREAAAEVLTGIPGDLCLPQLIPLLGSQRIEVRNLVATLIAKFDDGAVEYLLAALEHENEDVRKFSADILGMAQSDLAVEGLAKAMYDSAENVGVSAAEALGKIRSPKALPHLIKAFQDRDYLKRECAEAIGLIGIVEGSPFLMEQIFTTDDLLIKYALVDALGNAGDRKSIEFLEENAAKLEESLHEAVALSLLKIAQKEQINILDRPGVPLDVIFQSAANDNEEYQQLLIEQINEKVDPAILVKLAEAKSSLSSNAMVALIKAGAPHGELHEFVVEMVDHPDDWVAYTAIEQLGNLEEGKAAAVIKMVLEGSRTLPQLAAIKMVEFLALTDLHPVLEPFLASNDEDLRGLAEQVLRG